MSLDHAAYQAWLDRYVAAWKSYDPAAIGDLFSEDVEYRYHPLVDPVVGREAVVASWLESPDASGTYDGHYTVLAIDGETHVATGMSDYFDSEGDLHDQYSNVYVCTFDADGRCRRFTEWWRRNPRFAEPH